MLLLLFIGYKQIAVKQTSVHKRIKVDESAQLNIAREGSIFCDVASIWIVSVKQRLHNKRSRSNIRWRCNHSTRSGLKNQHFGTQWGRKRASSSIDLLHRELLRGYLITGEVSVYYLQDINWYSDKRFHGSLAAPEASMKGIINSNFYLFVLKACSFKQAMQYNSVFSILFFICKP